ncbi:MAG: ABC transporter ATP-binding protein/permease, partial [Lachnospiraceae bacterium]|nr:ABC transporter ATP-binding protein/permease [Lachnospiraceae bacterium]
MRKFQITRKALRRYHSYSPKYFPCRFLEIVFGHISPYFNLWMSAEIVNALYAGQEKSAVYRLVLITLCGNLLVQIMGAILGRAVNNAYGSLEDKEAEAFYEKTLSLDYDKLEDVKVRQLRRKIKENACINGYGMLFMHIHVEGLFGNLVDLVFSLVLFGDLVSKLTAVSFSWIGAGLLAAMAALIVLTVFVQRRANEKISAYWDETGEIMLRANRLSQGYSCPAMDNRIYKQQEIVNEMEKRENKLHFQVFSRAAAKDCLLSVPEEILLKLSEWCSYLIICFYCTLGAFPVGSIIKYVGYLGKITDAIGQIFYRVTALENNERFLAVYLEYFDISNDMYQGSLAVEKRSDGQFEVEFKNVSFAYAGNEGEEITKTAASNQDGSKIEKAEQADSGTKKTPRRYALENINLKLRVGERLAVVGQNGSGKTTFIKLLCRLYDPTKGEILMNDFNIRKYDYRQYLDLFSVVFQDYNLLAVTLGNNVASAAEWDKQKAERLLLEVGFGERYE